MVVDFQGLCVENPYNIWGLWIPDQQLLEHLAVKNPAI